ncbi:MAG: GAF domain-containing protein [Chloroflexi bacterium]|nr:GAF domain-containing protein [Chloroflexota bacterium]
MGRIFFKKLLPSGFTVLSLRKRITLIILAWTALCLGIFSWLGIRAVNENIERTLEERLLIARVVADYIDETLAHLVLQVRGAASSTRYLPAGEEFHDIAETVISQLAESGIRVQNIYLVGPDGRVRLSEPESAPAAGVDLSFQPDIAAALNGGEAVSDIVSNPVDKTPVIFISVPVSNQAGATIGVLAVAIDLAQSTVAAFSQALTIGQTGYTEIVDGNGIVLARTRPARPPAAFEQSEYPEKFASLIAKGNATVSVCHRCHEARAAVERSRDVIAFAPTSNATWGVAIRQTEEESLTPAMQLRQLMLLLGLVIIASAFAVVWVAMLGVVRPINTLTAATKKIAAGDFRAVIPFKRKDEIGQLSNALHSMTQDLARSRNELSKSRDELVLRNRELVSLNSIASAVNQSLNLDRVLDAAMLQIHDLAGTTAGCVFLRGADGATLQAVAGVGVPAVFRCAESASPAARCACHQVLRQGKTLMANTASQCPLLGQGRPDALGYFVCMPLKARDKVLGIMNIAGPDRNPFTENDFSILDSIASHIGLAIENSGLYEEARQKEQVRGQLLSSVINAQEEERKRIARELHDEYGQSLTALKVSIESIEDKLLPGQADLKEKLKNAAGLVVGSLEDLRRLTLALRPYALDELGLTSAIRAYARRHLEPLGINVKLETRGLDKRLAPQTETGMFRIVQEAVNNVIKHAGARNVMIRLAVREGKIAVTVEDDGSGFDVPAAFKSKVGTQSLGLLGIQERTTLLGGAFEIKSAIGQGTRLFVEIPADDLPRPAGESG